MASPADSVRAVASAILSWRTAWGLLGATVLALLLLHVPTIRSMARVWTDNESFSHCWFVAPLAAYMVSTRRSTLAEVAPSPTLLGVLAVLFFGGTWFLSHLAQVGIGEQFSLVGMLVGAVWAILGTEVCRRIAYPLAFLALMVPFGEGLFPVLISIAGKLAVAVLDWTGMPVTFDGRFLRVPGGEWTITEACSGLRYLLTILTVGAVFAYVNFERPLKRVLFLGICVAAAILMNGFRVWLLVVIGSLTDMKSPLVHDHVWLGWLLFAIMLLVIFQIGRRMADPEEGSAPVAPRASLSVRPGGTTRSLAIAAVLVIAIGTGWTVLAQAFDAPSPNQTRYAGPASDSGWTDVPYDPWEWKPFYTGASSEFQRAYEHGGEMVGLYVGYYRNQRQGTELIGTGHGFLSPDEDDAWKRSALTHHVVQASGRAVPVVQVDLEAPDVRLRVWRVYWAGGRFVTGEEAVKLQQLRSKLSGKGDDAAVLMIYSRYDERGDEATRRLQRFLSDRFDSLERSLWYTSGRGPSDPHAG